MLRVRHIVNTKSTMKLQFRSYFAEASKIETPDNAEVNEKFENVGKWVCTFTHPISRDEVKKEVAIISSKKKIVKKFKEFILSDFVASNRNKESENNNAQNLDNASLIIDDIMIDIRDLRKAVENKEFIRINTLIEDAVTALNTLQTKLSEIG